MSGRLILSLVLVEAVGTFLILDGPTERAITLGVMVLSWPLWVMAADTIVEWFQSSSVAHAILVGTITLLLLGRSLFRHLREIDWRILD